MSIAETIKQVREARGLTQEDLAEKCEVSRQAVSKWELGASAPTPENLKILEEVLEVTFPREEEPISQTAAKPPPNFWKITVTALGGLILAALLSILLYLTMSEPEQPPAPTEPAITGVWFFDEAGTPLEPDLGDGWKSFTVGQRVYLLVSFQQDAESNVYGAALYATPTGTETYDYRKQLAVQAVRDRPFALFPLDFPEAAMIHLDVTLECGGGHNVTETLNVTAVTVGEISSSIYEFENFEEAPADGSVIGEIRVDFSALPTSR